MININLSNILTENVSVHSLTAVRLKNLNRIICLFECKFIEKQI